MKVKVTQLCPTLCDPMDYTVHRILQARILEWVAVPSPADFPNPGIDPRSPTLQADSLPAEPPGKPKNTGVGSLSLLQQIFLAQESNRGLLCCRRILYQLSSILNCTVAAPIYILPYTNPQIFSVKLVDLLHIHVSTLRLRYGTFLVPL